MVSVASKVPFVDLCKVCEKISSKQGSDKKRQVLLDFISTWRNFHEKLHKTPTEDSFYPAMRLLLPQFDKDRGAYGIKENTLAKLYIEILNLNKESADAQRLLNYRIPKTTKGDVGDFASVAFYVLKHRCPDAGTLTIQDINADLDGVALNNANKKKDAVKQHLLHLLRNTSAMEQKWLIRMIMKELKFGLSETSVLNVYHQDAKDLYDVTNNLAKVCLSLRDPTVRLHEIDISLFAAFRPMLAERASPEKVEQLMQHNEFYIETKYDGERMQIHKNQNEYKYFSRGTNPDNGYYHYSGYEYTQSYGSSPQNGNLTPFIDAAFDSTVKECILDGEMVGYSKQTKCIGSKGENFDVKFLKDGDDYQPCYCVFDILLYNGKVLSNLPLHERLKYLDDIIKPVEGRLQHTIRKNGQTKQDVVNALNLAIDQHEEGIVLKKPDSVYRPNVRKGGWFKIKPEYIDGLMDQLDLIVIGGYFGEGYRSRMISHFLLGVAETPENKDEYPTIFHSVCRVGSGYSLAELYELCLKLNDHWHPYDKRRPPKSILLASGHRERPDLWIEPKNSKIVQVKAAEIVDSAQFKTGCTFRFPRVEKVRYDKPWYECMTTTELEEMRTLAAGKLATRHLLDNEEDDGEPSPKKKRGGGGGAAKLNQPVAVPQHFLGIDPSQIHEVSQLLQGQEFCVANGLSHTKHELEKIIVENGGSIVQNPRSSTLCVLADQVTLKVTNIIKSELYDVLKSDWMLKCLAEKAILKWTPNDVLYSTPSTARKLAMEYDKYGDSYTVDVTSEELKTLFESMPRDKSLKQKEIAELEDRYFPNSSPHGMFRIYKIYMDVYLLIGDKTTKMSVSSLELVEIDLRFYGATISTMLDDEVTHVVVDSRCVERVGEMRAINRERQKKFHIVTEEWVHSSISKGSVMNETLYGPALTK